MSGKVNYRPSGSSTVSAYLVVADVDMMVDFLKRVFDAEETERMTLPDGRVMHTEVRIGDSIIMMGEPGEGSMPRTSMLHVYVENVDEVYRVALEAGAVSLQEPVNQFYGDRSAGVQDILGNQWWIATHIEEVSPAEMQRRAEALGR